VDDIIQCFRTEVPTLLDRIERSFVDGTAVEQAVPLRALQTMLTNLGFVAAAAYCRAELETVAAGMRPDPEIVSTLDQLIEAGLHRCETIVTSEKTVQPFASAA
jgi:hypothetical protein